MVAHTITKTLSGAEMPAFSTLKRSLRIVHSSDKAAEGRFFEFDGSSFVLGRGGSRPTLIDDERMSREHVRLVPGRIPGSYVIEDLQTKNGAFLNAARIHPPTS